MKTLTLASTVPESWTSTKTARISAIVEASVFSNASRWSKKDEPTKLVATPSNSEPAEQTNSFPDMIREARARVGKKNSAGWQKHVRAFWRRRIQDDSNQRFKSVLFIRTSFSANGAFPRRLSTQTSLSGVWFDFSIMLWWKPQWVCCGTWKKKTWFDVWSHYCSPSWEASATHTLIVQVWAKKKSLSWRRLSIFLTLMALEPLTQVNFAYDFC